MNTGRHALLLQVVCLLLSLGCACASFQVPACTAHAQYPGANSGHMPLRQPAAGLHGSWAASAAGGRHGRRQERDCQGVR
jgi:hypothetical protein